MPPCRQGGRGGRGGGCNPASMAQSAASVTTTCCAGDGIDCSMGVPSDCTAECAPIYLDFMEDCGDMLAQTPLVGPQYTALQEKCQAVAPGGDKDGLSETGGKPAPPWIFTRRRQIFFVAPTLNFKIGMKWPRICHRERRVRHELGGVDYDGVRPDGGTARAGRGPRRPWRRRHGPVPHTLLRHAPALRCSSAPLLPALSRIPRSDKKRFVSFGLFATRSRKDSLVVPIGYEVLL